MQTVSLTRFEIFAAVTMKSLWDVMSRGSCMNRRFRGTFRFHRYGDKNRRVENVSSNYQRNHAAKNLITLLMEAILSSETSVVLLSACFGCYLLLTLLLFRYYTLPKRRFLHESHAVTYQKTASSVSLTAISSNAIRATQSKRGNIVPAFN
jgi:hypothetical protein